MAVSAQQKALLLLERKGCFSVENIDVPSPRPGETLVRLEAISLNPVEWKIQITGFIIDNYPAVLGHDAAGVAVAVQLGEGVSTFNIGDRVYVRISSARTDY